MSEDGKKPVSEKTVFGAAPNESPDSGEDYFFGGGSAEEPADSPAVPEEEVPSDGSLGNHGFQPHADGDVVSMDGAPSGRIPIGARFNNIYEVRRFIAAGGMGEVYEGVNLTNENERVALKIILPHLVADVAAQNLFRKEADTLTHLSHPSLVKYRLIAREPQLDVLYIVTEFIDGPALSDVLSTLNAGHDEIAALLRWLAAGLAEAHSLGKIHRDISPDNILLPGGKLARAKIIDFGIAKDLSPSSKTIVGGGLAGKLGYMAPEQLGDHRNIGPWTDIYSLGLVLLSLARGKPVDMGVTIAEAVKKRASVPDLSPLPENLRPLFAKMLNPIWSERPSSMADVLRLLEDCAREQPRTQSRAPWLDKVTAVWKSAPAPLLYGGVAVLLLLFSAMSFVYFMAPSVPQNPIAKALPVRHAAGPARNDVRLVRVAIETALNNVDCSWLDQDAPQQTANGVLVPVVGVAPSPEGLPAVLEEALARAGISTPIQVDSSRVSRADARSCAALNAYRHFRQPSSELGRSLVPQQQSFTLQDGLQDCKEGPHADVINDVYDREPAEDVSLFGVEATGAPAKIIPDRTELNRLVALDNHLHSEGDHIRWSICVDQESAHVNADGLVGFMMITGQGPFNVVSSPHGFSDADAARFIADGERLGWKTQMAWIRVTE